IVADHGRDLRIPLGDHRQECIGWRTPGEGGAFVCRWRFVGAVVEHVADEGWAVRGKARTTRLEYVPPDHVVRLQRPRLEWRPVGHACQPCPLRLRDLLVL